MPSGCSTCWPSLDDEHPGDPSLKPLCRTARSFDAAARVFGWAAIRLGSEGMDDKHGPEALPCVQVLGVEPVAPSGDRGLHYERVPEGEPELLEDLLAQDSVAKVPQSQDEVACQALPVLRVGVLCPDEDVCVNGSAPTWYGHLSTAPMDALEAPS
jgi:hypothetical protein